MNIYIFIYIYIGHLPSPQAARFALSLPFFCGTPPPASSASPPCSGTRHHLRK